MVSRSWFVFTPFTVLFSSISGCCTVQANTGKAAGPGDSAQSPEKPARSQQESQAIFEVRTLACFTNKQNLFHGKYVSESIFVPWSHLTENFVS